MFDRLLLFASAAAGLAAPATAQFTLDTSGLPIGPGINSYTEALDFGDVDLDGDWDVVFADGGDSSNDENRIWINSGGAQAGTVGTFTDETATRLPAVADTSRDIEFADLDGDGDLDVFAANTAQIVNQSSRFWINSGGQQGGSLGFFTDETSTRWLDLGQSGSSVAPFQVLGIGGYIGWGADGDFADLDNDGDLDLIHSSYGGSFSGGPPTRLFLNDGAGFFSEFNPSGFQLPSVTMPEGAPALWASGLQQTGTSDTSGAFADIATVAQDVEIGDLDGDFDLDFLLGDLNGSVRVFQNGLEEQSGTLGFRDVSAAALPPDAIAGSFTWDQEFGDLDQDGDLDLYGAHWGGDLFSLDDRVLHGDGALGFTIYQSQVPGSTLTDTEEIDFVDFDNDGDLDAVTAPFAGENYLFENDGTGTMSLAGSMDFATLHDVETCDLDEDGDFDLMIGSEWTPNAILRNNSQIPDTTAPWFGGTEVQVDFESAPGSVPLRTAVLDNVPFELYESTEVTLEVTVEGCPFTTAQAVHSGGQVFRAELPTHVLGSVELLWRAIDERGNTAVVPGTPFEASSGLDVFATVGSGTPSAQTGVAPELRAVTVPFAGTSLAICIGGAPSAGYLFGLFTAAAPAPIDLPGIGLLNIAGTQLVFDSGTLDAGGFGLWSTPLSPLVPAGIDLFAQAFTSEGSAGGDLFASSAGLRVRTF